MFHRYTLFSSYSNLLSIFQNLNLFHFLKSFQLYQNYGIALLNSDKYLKSYGSVKEVCNDKKRTLKTQVTLSLC